MPHEWSGRRKARLPSNWQRIRAQILARDVTCVLCGVRPATHCDHIVAQADLNGPADLQGVCQPCHQQKSSQEGHAARRNKPGRKRPDEPHPGLL